MSEKYYMIYQLDTNATVIELTKEEALKRVEDFGGEEAFMDKIPFSDPAEWGMRPILIKGEIVTPEPVQKVTEYTLK